MAFAEFSVRPHERDGISLDRVSSPYTLRILTKWGDRDVCMSEIEGDRCVLPSRKYHRLLTQCLSRYRYKIRTSLTFSTYRIHRDTVVKTRNLCKIWTRSRISFFLAQCHRRKSLDRDGVFAGSKKAPSIKDFAFPLIFYIIA